MKKKGASSLEKFDQEVSLLFYGGMGACVMGYPSWLHLSVIFITVSFKVSYTSTFPPAAPRLKICL